MDEVSEYVLSEALKTKIKINAYRYEIDYDDLYHSYVCARLQGRAKHQTIDQFTWDYLRMHRSIKRTFEEYNEFHDSEISLDIFTKDDNLTFHSFVDMLSPLQSESARVFALLRAFVGLTVTDIATVMGVEYHVLRQRMAMGVMVPERRKNDIAEITRLVKETQRLKKEIIALEKENKRINRELLFFGRNIQGLTNMTDVKIYFLTRIKLFPNQEEAAKSFGVSSRTLRNWLRDTKYVF